MRWLHPRTLIAALLFVLEIPILGPIAIGALISGLVAGLSQAWRWITSSRRRTFSRRLSGDRPAARGL
jgi:hypothetical protein